MKLKQKSIIFDSLIDDDFETLQKSIKILITKLLRQKIFFINYDSIQ